MFIARNHSFINDMSQEKLCRFRSQERLEFPPYMEDQLMDILKERLKESFRENAVSDEIITFIAENAAKYGNGDARYALLLSLSAGWAADREDQSAILPEHVREAQEKTDPKIKDEDLIMLSDDEKLCF